MVSSIFLHSLPRLIENNALNGGIAVVIDVLRATTVMVHAIDSGVVQILPCLEIEEARTLASTFPTGSTLLGGERLGLPIEGFDLGNSPAAYTSERCAGKSLVMTTTNGTKAIHASLSAERVLIAAFVNRTATLQAIESDPSPRAVHLVCAGTDGQISLEDNLLGGALASGLVSMGGQLGNDEARMACRLWDSLNVDDDSSTAANRLYEVLSEGRGGRRVREIGLEPDLRDASRIDRFSFAVELFPNPTRLLRI